MSDRKYRQRGYKDESSEGARNRKMNPETRPLAPGAREPRRVSLPGFHDVVRCAQCGRLLEASVESEIRCSGCGTYLHSCVQCTWFDTSSHFECTKPVTERISPKDARNECPLFEVRITVERRTHSTGPTDTKRVFDALFK